MNTSDTDSGIVHLVGAGPGDPALLTCRGAELLRRADVVVYDGLVHAVLLDLAPAACERIYAGKKHAPAGHALTQTQINDLLVNRARMGKRVVRLKGGDPFVFGRGAEECQVLHEAGIRFEIVPGVTAATAVPAYAGIPLTARSAASTVAFATGHEAAGKPTTDVDWQALARAGTVVLFMALRTAAECARRLIEAGRDPATPAAAIHWGTTASQRTVVAPLRELSGAIAAAGLKPPTLLVIGEVVTLRPWLDWFERRPLFGARVLVPRGLEQAGPFAQSLAEFGAEPVIVPVTRQVPPDAGEGAHLDTVCARLGQGQAGASHDWLVLTSANAVARFLDALHARGRDARALAGMRIACVGRATARALAGRGLLADLVPERGSAEAMADAIIAAAGAVIRGARILLPRAAQGREEGVDRLRAAGAEVEVVTVYRTETVPADDLMVRHGLDCLMRGDIDVIAFFAPSQVQAVIELVRARGGDEIEVLRGCRVVAAIGKTTRDALAGRGIDVHVVPAVPDADVLAEEIAAFYGSRSQEAQP